MVFPLEESFDFFLNFFLVIFGLLFQLYLSEQRSDDLKIRKDER